MTPACTPTPYNGVSTALPPTENVVYRPYAGIGSRDIPVGPLHRLLIGVGAGLARNGFTLRSGGARGCDSLFEYGHRNCEPRNGGPEIQPPEIFRPEPPPPEWTFRLVREFLDPGRKLETFGPGVRNLLARNMQQVLGRNGDSPSMFVLYWTAAESYEGPEAGGTRYALRCAERYGVPMLNLGRSEIQGVRSGSDTVAKVLNWCRDLSDDLVNRAPKPKFDVLRDLQN